MAKRRRRADDLHYIHVQVRAQQKSNLQALASAHNLTLGETIDRLIVKAVSRHSRARVSGSTVAFSLPPGQPGASLTK